MPRDGSGVYSLPSGNPVVTGTVIASAWANSTLSDIAAQLNNVFTRDGLLGPTGPFKIVDGTVAAPGLAWNSEPGMGWYRSSAGARRFAVGGFPIEIMEGAAASTGGILLPRAAGAASWALRNQPAGVADYNQSSLVQNADGTTTLQNFGVGAATAKPINYTAASHSFTGTVVGNSGMVTTGFQCANIELVEATFPFIDFRVGGAPDFSVRVNGNSSWPSRLTVSSQTVNTMLLVEGTSGGVSFAGVANSNAGANTIAFGWRTDATLGLRVDGSQFGNTWPISITGTATTATTAVNANAVNGISGWNYSNRAKQPTYIWCTDGAQNDQYLTTPANLTVGAANFITNFTFDLVSAMGFASGDVGIPYMRRTGQPDIRRLLWQTTNDDTVRSLRLTGINPGVNAAMEVSGTSGAWGVTVNASDERLKSNIVPSSVNGIAALEAMELIEYDAGEVHELIGFRAQNLQRIDPHMVFGVEQPEGSPFYELGTILNPNDHVVLAYVVKAVKELIDRVAKLEAV
jgi:hypothetical protein